MASSTGRAFYSMITMYTKGSSTTIVSMETDTKGSPRRTIFKGFTLMAAQKARENMSGPMVSITRGNGSLARSKDKGHG